MPKTMPATFEVLIIFLSNVETTIQLKFIERKGDNCHFLLQKLTQAAEWRTVWMRARVHREFSAKKGISVSPIDNKPSARFLSFKSINFRSSKGMSEIVMYNSVSSNFPLEHKTKHISRGK